MIDVNWRHAQVSDRNLLACGEGNVFHHGTVLVPKFSKTRIDVVVENITLQQIDYFLGSMNANRLSQLAEEIVNKDWQACDMVHVRMSDNDVAHGLPLCFRQRKADAAGVDRHAIVDKEAGQALRRRRAAVGVK